MSSLRFDPSQQPQPSGRTKKALGKEPARSADLGLELDKDAHEDQQSMLSIVVPAKNEAPGLPQLVSEIVVALRPLCGAECTQRRLAGFEIIVVDDASTDETRSVLEYLGTVYPELNGISLSVSTGQSGATIAGIRAACGNWIGTLDADLQNDPADLIRLWNALSGNDVVLGWRTSREDRWCKRIISRWANRARNAVLGQSIRDTGCSVRIFPRALALRLPVFDGVHRFLGPLLLREGCRMIQVPVRHRPRTHGQSHYNVWNRSIRVVVDLVGVTWLMRRPLRYQALAGGDSRSAIGQTGTGRNEPCRT